MMFVMTTDDDLYNDYLWFMMRSCDDDDADDYDEGVYQYVYAYDYVYMYMPITILEIDGGDNGCDDVVNNADDAQQRKMRVH